MATSEKTNFNLLVLIINDLGRHPMLLILYFAVIASALGVVVMTHKNRQLLIEHEQLIEEKDRLDIEWRHLVIEQNALTEHNRIERLVKEKFDMHRPTSDEVILIREK